MSVSVSVSVSDNLYGSIIISSAGLEPIHQTPMSLPITARNFRMILSQMVIPPATIVIIFIEIANDHLFAVMDDGIGIDE